MRLALIPNEAWEKARQVERDVEGSGLTMIMFTEIGTACTWLGIDVDVAAILDELRAEITAGA